MNNTKFKIITGLLLVFILGAICGVLGTGIFIKQRFQRLAQGGPGEHRDFFVDRLAKELALSDEQKTQAEEIFKSTEDEIQTLLENSRKQFENLMDQRRVELREILDAGQQEKLDAFFEQLKTRRPGSPRPGGPPGAPPPDGHSPPPGPPPDL
jgi:Spy/CpxP family protein refolding chaperone